MGKVLVVGLLLLVAGCADLTPEQRAYLSDSLRHASQQIDSAQANNAQAQQNIMQWQVNEMYQRQQQQDLHRSIYGY